MTMHSKPGKVVGALLLWAVMAFGAQAATEAGSVSFAFGDATIEGTDGAERTARRGATLYSGDTISTGPRGRVQMRFTDGGFVSLTPDTSFRIDEYRFEGEADGSEKGFFSLIKGGMRALTGLVGRKNRESYQLSTVVATIGIRGTLYRATFDPVIMKFLASVGVDPTDPDSGIRVTAGGRSVVIGPGGSVVVEGEGAPPRPTTEQAQVAAAQPADEDGDGSGGEDGDVDQSALVSGADEDGVAPPDVVPSEILGVLDANAYALALAFLETENGGLVVDIEPDGGDDTLPGNIVDVLFTTPTAAGDALVGGFDVNEFSIEEVEVGLTTISRGVAEAFVTALAGEDFGLTAEDLTEIEQFIDETFANAATNADVSHDDATGLTWGRWTGGNVLEVDFNTIDNVTEIDVVELTGNQSDHWIYGPRPDSLPTQGLATYSFVGGTPSTAGAVSSGGDVVGIGQGITAGTITADFGSLFVQTDLTVDHGGAIDVMTSGSMFSNRTGFATMGDGFSDPTGPCYPSCGAYVNGVFTDASGGAAPDGVGASFKLQPANAPDDYITGVGGFKQDSFNPQDQNPL